MTTADLPVTPALYTAQLRHLRRAAPRRDFTHRVYLWLVDLDALPRLPWWLRPFAVFRAADHLGRPERSIRANLDAWLAGQGIDLAGGRVLMLANARVAGYVFNPITLYWCHRPDGALACVVAEVHNTYGERHCYLLDPDETGRATADKRLYVSPFQPLDGDYLMRVPRPGRELAITVVLRHQGEVALTATLNGTRQPASPANLARLLLRQPLMPHRVALSIRRHGIALWARRVPITPRAPHIHQEGIR